MSLEIDETQTDTVPWYNRPSFRGWEAALPFIRWGIILLILLVQGYLWQRDTNAEGLTNMTTIRRDQDALRKEVEANRDDWNNRYNAFESKVLTREVFEAYHKADVDRMDRMEKLEQQILDHTQPYRSNDAR